MSVSNSLLPMCAAEVHLDVDAMEAMDIHLAFICVISIRLRNAVCLHRSQLIYVEDNAAMCV